MPSEARIREALDDGALRTVFQPVYDLSTGEVTGVEALTRFAGPEGPARWFAAAHAIGLGVDLELAALHTALDTASSLPEHIRLWVNLSPAALVDPRALGALTRRHGPGLGVEITEQSAATGYHDLQRQRDRLAALGIRVAVDDVGGGQSSLRHLRRLRPDHVKVDLSVTAELETSRLRRLQMRRLVRRVRRREAVLIAEGVETPAQLALWQRLGADAVQGFFLATPAPLAEALRMPPIGAVARPTAARA